jgi:branched-chain amino acid transport system permease protein
VNNETPARAGPETAAPPSPGAVRPRYRLRDAAVALALAAGFAAVPLAGSAYTLQLATDILTFTTLAYGWNLISGFTGYLSFGQVSFFGLGAYTTGVAVLHTPLPWYVAVCLGGLVAALAAIVLGPIMLRLRGI